MPIASNLTNVDLACIMIAIEYPCLRIVPVPVVQCENSWRVFEVEQHSAS